MNVILRLTSLIGAITLFLIGLLFENIYVMLASVLLILMHNILYSLKEFYKRIIFFSFNITFFVFLIGRMLVVSLFNYKSQHLGLLGLAFHEKDKVLVILACQFISLLSLFIGYITIQRLDLKFLKGKKEYSANFINNFRIISLLLFFFCMIFRIYYLIEMQQVASTEGYYDTFSTFTSSLPSVLVLFSEMYDVALFSYLATNPSKKRSIIPIGLYIFEGLMAAIAGRRSVLMLNLLIILIYFCIRSINDSSSKENKVEKWFGKKEFVFVSILFPILMVFMTIIEVRRSRYSRTDPSNYFEAILNFFYSQGISANLIGYGQMYKESLPKAGFYTFGPIFEFIDSKVIRPLKGLPELFGQTVQRALEGHLFSHAISYLIMPTLYLSGVGYGSSFIAELFVDFSYLGVFIGSMIYGSILFILMYILRNSNLILITFALLMTRQILFAPRGAALAFLVSAFSTSKILAVGIIIFGTILLGAIKRKKYSFSLTSG
ncbi:O-antigen polysaccharide polymerase Wzy family protein [Bacillus andreraoultii]|uniref:O-antigen polysaccharide polymerase Wzy family protein n=1 Tax=Bacillus andreraoultii TaxID=1499685 RepID=UPI00053A6859|nr:O-antigen polysaccharide polymerase Wzy family protein [Bacillus andreraoultii]